MGEPVPTPPVGLDAKAADKILLVLEELLRVAGLLHDELSAEISDSRAAQLAAAVHGVSDERFSRDLTRLTEWVTANNREELTAAIVTAISDGFTDPRSRRPQPDHSADRRSRRAPPQPCGARS